MPKSRLAQWPALQAVSINCCPFSRYSEATELSRQKRHPYPHPHHSTTQNNHDWEPTENVWQLRMIKANVLTHHGLIVRPRMEALHLRQLGDHCVK